MCEISQEKEVEDMMENEPPQPDTEHGPSEADCKGPNAYAFFSGTIKAMLSGPR